MTSTVDYLNISGGYINSTMNSSSSGTIACISYTGSSYNTFSISGLNITINKLTSGTSYLGVLFYYAYG